eukprot:COSAG02_NODE_1785_length_10940_cov_9.153399_3_plen_185_part_00
MRSSLSASRLSCVEYELPVEHLHASLHSLSIDRAILRLAPRASPFSPVVEVAFLVIQAHPPAAALPLSRRVHGHSGEETARWGSYSGTQAALPMSGSMAPQQTQRPANPMGAPPCVPPNIALPPPLTSHCRPLQRSDRTASMLRFGQVRHLTSQSEPAVCRVAQYACCRHGGADVGGLRQKRAV